VLGQCASLTHLNLGLNQIGAEGAGRLAAVMIVLFIVLARNKLRIPLEGTYSREM